MDLTPTTPITKRTRAKATATTSAPAEKKPTLTIKKPRTRKKAEGAAVESPTTLLQKPTTEQLLAMISTAAYYRARERNFAPGGELEDWLAAERQVLAELT